jgi:hypothetical protein
MSRSFVRFRMLHAAYLENTYNIFTGQLEICYYQGRRLTAHWNAQLVFDSLPIVYKIWKRLKAQVAFFQGVG